VRKFIEISSDKYDHGGAGWEYGTCLWSPVVSDVGAKIYELMNEPSKNDQIIHFYKEKNTRYIHGYSHVQKTCYVTNNRPSVKTEWDRSDSFYRIDLKDFKKFKDPIALEEFRDLFDIELRHEIEENPSNYPFQVTKTKNPRYKVDSFVGLVNGKYFRECTSQLFTLIKEIEDIEDKNVEDKKDKSLTNKEDYFESRRKIKETTFFARNPKLKKDAIKIRGYKCEACGFLFADKYGRFGADYIECHHENPISERPEKDWTDKLKTSIDEVKLLCSNCHRMIHHTRPAKKFHDLLVIIKD